MKNGSPEVSILKNRGYKFLDAYNGNSYHFVETARGYFKNFLRWKSVTVSIHFAVTGSG